MRYSKINKTTFAKAWTPPSPIGRFFSPNDAFYGAHGWLNAPSDPHEDVVRRPR